MANERMDALKKMLEESPSDAFLNYALALEWQKLGKTEQATEQLQKLLASHPDYLSTYYQLGKMHEQAGNFTQAIHVYSAGKTLAKQQGNTKTLGELAEAIFLLEDD